MVKRNRPTTSEADDEDDCQQPMKQQKGNRNARPFTSTPYTNYAPFFEGPSTSTAVPQNQSDTPVTPQNRRDTPVTPQNQRDTPLVPQDQRVTPVVEQNTGFTSFLKSRSLVDDESDRLTDFIPRKTRYSAPFQSVTTPTPIQIDTTQSCIPTLDTSVKTVSEEISPKEPRVLRVPYQCLDVISAQHPTTLTLHGYLEMTVLVGTVSVQGYDVTRNNSAYIFSSKKTGYRMVTTKPSVVRIPKGLKEILKEIAVNETDAKLDEFMASIGSFTSVFVLKKTVLPPPLQFLQLYFPNAVEMDTPKRNARGSDMFSRMGSNVIEVRPEVELIASEFTEDFCSAGQRILVHGPKGSGKSTLLRYLVHKVLNTGTDVFYLDTDPGQTEFTPPGTLSLTKVTKPLLTPPFCHQSHPIRMIFTGSSTPAANLGYFLECVQNLLKFYNADDRKAVLFVNTVGWVEGAGEVFSQAIHRVVEPTMLIHFESPEICPIVKIEKTGDNCTHVHFPIKKYVSQNMFSSKDLREFALTAYLGKGQKYYMRPMFLNSFKPVTVKWDEVAIAVMGRRLEHSRIISAINGSFVALCYVEETEIITTMDAGFFTLKDEPVNVCIGYGFVRAIDETNHLLYIVTPLSLEKLQKVNAVVKGNINVPNEFFIKQPIYNTPLPYTMESKNPPASINKSVKKRTFIPQQTPKA